MPVDPGQLDKALRAIKSAYGESTMRSGSEKPELRRIPTGSLELDYAIGGGVPLGRFCHFYGPKGSGKTVVAYNVIAQAQKMGLKCAYYNAEKQYDKVWCEKQGIDTSSLELVETTVIEEIGAIAETLLGSVHVHVIDSLATCISADELSSKTEEWRPGISARAWGKVLRKLNQRFDDTENTVIMVNQVGTTFGYGGGEEPKGGKQVEYISRLSLKFKKSGWLYKNAEGILTPEGKGTDTLTGDKEPDGHEFQVRVAKTAGFGQQDRTARIRVDYESASFDEMWTLAKAAKFFGVVESSGAWYTYGKKKVQGQNGLRQLIQDDPDLARKIREAMFSV